MNRSIVIKEKKGGMCEMAYCHCKSAYIIRASEGKDSEAMELCAYCLSNILAEMVEFLREEDE